jgi:hypothetical protein
MKKILDWIVNTFAKVRSFIAQFIGELIAVAVAIRQFIVGDWFGGIAAVVIAAIILVVNALKK